MATSSKKATTACALWLGDWLNYGEARFGEKYHLAVVRTGLDYGTLRNAAYTARRVALSDRSDKLGYKHHELVAPLPRPAQRELLQEAQRKRLSVRELQARIGEYKKARMFVPAMPREIYSVLYVDPPWEIEALVCNKRRDPLPYATLSHEELKALPLPKLASDCVIFLWTTLSTLPQAPELLAHWQLRYHLTFTWDKGGGFCMTGFHRKSELVLVGYRGILANVIKQEGAYIPTVFYEAKTTHSTKPRAMYEFIETRTVGNRIELFARKRRIGWDAWGDEIAEAEAL